MINISEELKSRISIEDVVARYWEEPDRAHRVKCFAHNGKDRNMLVKNGFVYCFVCGARFDIIGTVQHLFGLSFIQACEKLNSDFNCGLPIGKKLTRSEVEELKRAEANRKREIEIAQIKKIKENNIYSEVCKQLKLSTAILTVLKPANFSINNQPSEMFMNFYIDELKSNKWLEWLSNALIGVFTDCEFSLIYDRDKNIIYDKLISGELTI